MPRRTAEEIDAILSAHFNAYPSHWTDGTGNRPAVSAVVAMTGIAAASVSEWARANRPSTMPTVDPATVEDDGAQADSLARAAAHALDMAQAAVASSASKPGPEAHAFTIHPTPAHNPQAPTVNKPAIAPVSAPFSNALDVGDIGALANGLAKIQADIGRLAAERDKANADAAREAEEATKAKAERDALARECALLKASAASAIALPLKPADPTRVPAVDPTHVMQAVDKEIDWSLRHRSPLLITGPTGSGKTAPVVQACARAGRTMRRVCFDGETLSTDLIGRRDAIDGKTVWTDGVLPQAMEAGDVLLVDEIDRADESCRAALFSVLDSRTLFLPVSGRHVTAAPGFQLIACCNGVGDATGQYTGTQPIDAAFIGRWTDVLRVDYPTPEVEEQMIRAAVPGVQEFGCKKIAELFKVLRQAMRDGHLAGPFSIRQSKRMAELYHLFRIENQSPADSIARALDRALLGRETPDNRAVIRETTQRVMGNDAVAKVQA